MRQARGGCSGWPLNPSALSAHRCAPRVHRLALPELLTHAPLVLPTPETALRAAFDGLIDQLGITPNIAAEADDMAMLRLLARADAGFAILPPIAVQDELRQGVLVELKQLDGIDETFLAITRTRRFPTRF